MNVETFKYTKTNTHVPDSYKCINTQLIGEYVLWIIENRKIRNYPITRSKESYVREWKGHNRLYNLHLFRKHTKDVDLDENMSMFWEIVWLIIGGI